MAHATNGCSSNGDAQMHALDAEPQADDSILIRLEVQQAATSAVAPEVITERVRQLLSSRRLQYRDGHIPFSAEDDQLLAENVVAISIVDTDTDQEAPQGTPLLFWQVCFHAVQPAFCTDTRHRWALPVPEKASALWHTYAGAS